MRRQVRVGRAHTLAAGVLLGAVAVGGTAWALSGAPGGGADVVALANKAPVDDNPSAEPSIVVVTQSPSSTASASSASSPSSSSPSSTPPTTASATATGSPTWVPTARAKPSSTPSASADDDADDDGGHHRHGDDDRHGRDDRHGGDDD